MPENNSPRLIQRARVALVTSQWVQLEGTQETIASPRKPGNSPHGLGRPKGLSAFPTAKQTCSEGSINADLTSEAPPAGSTAMTRPRTHQAHSTRSTCTYIPELEHVLRVNPKLFHLGLENTKEERGEGMSVRDKSRRCG